MSFFRELKYQIQYIFEDLILLAKHPSRKDTIRDLKYNFNRLVITLVIHPWYCLKRGIRNIYIWGPTIWKNDCWDYYYLLDMLDIQLKEMEDFWLKQAEYERKELSKEVDVGFRCQYRRIYKRIKWTRKYMSMWRDEHYVMKSYYDHKNRFPNEPEAFEHDESLTKYDEFGVPISYTCKPMSEPAKVDYITNSKKAREMDEKTMKLWLKSLSHVQRWWH